MDAYRTHDGKSFRRNFMVTARECQTTPAFDCLNVDSQFACRSRMLWGEKVIQVFAVFVRDWFKTSHFSCAAHKNQNEANISISHRKLSGKIRERAKKDSFFALSAKPLPCCTAVQSVSFVCSITF